MIDHIETINQLRQVGEFYCPIINGRTHPCITVSIPRANPIPEGWRVCAARVEDYPADTIRIKLSYDPTRP